MGAIIEIGVGIVNYEVIMRNVENSSKALLLIGFDINLRNIHYGGTDPHTSFLA